MSLLRAPQSPDPIADLGLHEFSYGLVPGAELIDAIREGYRVNLPLRRLGGSGEPVAPLVVVDGEGVVVESIKLADDESGDVVVRLYEALGRRCSGRLKADFDHASAETVDLVERPLETAGVEVDGQGVVTLTLRPFQIVTVRFRR